MEAGGGGGGGRGYAGKAHQFHLMSMKWCGSFSFSFSFFSSFFLSASVHRAGAPIVQLLDLVWGFRAMLPQRHRSDERWKGGCGGLQ